jgi:integrase
MNILTTAPFNDAAEAWLEWHKEQDIKPRTIESYKYYIGTLGKTFGGKLLSQITVTDVLEYQQQRKKLVSAGLVNHELNCLQQIMDAADLWTGIEKHYRQLKPPQWTPPKVLTPEDEERFFKVAATRTEWQVALWACTVANNTGAVGQELFCLQLQHIFLDHQPPKSIAKIHINDKRVKNEFRARVIPLNAAALEAMSKLVERAKKLGAYSPFHYVIPYRVARNRFDVTRPASRSFIRRAFNEIKEAAGLPWLQPRNFRNQVITRLFENGEPDETVRAIAGHNSIRMSQHYSKIRIEAKADALNNLGVPEKKPVRAVTHDLAVKANAAITESVGALIKKLKRAGLAPEQILGILADEGEA